MSGPLKTLRHGGVHGCLLCIRHRRIERGVAEHFLRFRNLLQHTGSLTGVAAAHGTCEVELVAGTVDEGGHVGVREADRAVALQGNEAGVV